MLPKETPLQSAKKADSYPFGALVLYIATKASMLCPQNAFFSMNDTYHHIVTNWFIIAHNLAMKSLLSPLT